MNNLEKNVICLNHENEKLLNLSKRLFHCVQELGDIIIETIGILETIAEGEGEEELKEIIRSLILSMLEKLKKVTIEAYK